MEGNKSLELAGGDVTRVTGQGLTHTFVKET